jgi:hypothetical protein
MVRLLAQVSTISPELANEYLVLYNKLEEEMKNFLIDDNFALATTPDVKDQRKKTHTEEMMLDSEITAIQAIAMYLYLLTTSKLILAKS